jgi:hypothetical protein
MHSQETMKVNWSITYREEIKRVNYHKIFKGGIEQYTKGVPDLEAAFKILKLSW